MPANWLAGDRRELLARLAGRHGVRPRTEPIPVRPASDAPASSAQQRLWFLQRLAGDSPLYHMAGAIRLRGPLDSETLRASLTRLVHRHEALRTTFSDDGGSLRQHVAEPYAVELTAEPVEGNEAAIVDEFVRRPFDLAAGPPMRQRLLRTGPDEHLLIVVVHHIVADGWSVELLVEQLFDDHAEAPLVQYGDYSAWESAALAPGRLDEELDHWARLLRDAEPPELPTDHLAPARPTFAGAVERFTLPAATGDRLLGLAAAHRTSPFVVGLAALGVVLARWSRQTDVVIGSPFSGRTRPELHRTVGCFVNTLPLRLDVAPARSFGDLVDLARERVLDAQRHESVPFDLLVERLRPRRDRGGRSPFVRHLFRYQERPPRQVAVGGLTVSFHELDTGTAKFDLTVELAPGTDGSLAGLVEYSTELFTAATVRRVIGGLGAVLAAADSAVPVGHLPVLTAADRAEVLGFADGGPALAGAEETLTRLIEDGFDRWPDRIAAVDDTEKLTAAELDRRANQLAHRLRELGVSAGTPVAVLVPRSTRLLVALVAVLKAGAAIVPLDPGHPPARHAAVLAQVPVVITEGAGTPHSTVVDLGTERLDALPVHRLGPVAGPDSLAYVVHTSGSTGRPKGAMNEHRAVVNRLRWMQRTFSLDAGEAVLQKTPVGFDVSIWELFWPLFTGARCVLPAPGVHSDPRALAEAIVAHRVTTVHFVPSMLDAFLASGAASGCAGVLERIVCSGEELPARLLAETAAALPGVQVHNLYGPAEAAVDVSWHPCPAGPPARRVPIGRPIPGARLYVVDDVGALAPVGMPGELWIGGVACGRGYLGRPDLTAERFVADPFLGTPMARAYRTGDLARWLPDGTLDYLGRIDRQVKIRGVRIEPGEVEHVLTGHPDVSVAAVGPRRSPAGEPVLVAWYRPGGAEVDEDALRRHLRAHLPQAMCPAALVAVRDWPVNGNGKLDWAALPAPAMTGYLTEHVPPRDDLERALADIWAELLDVAAPGVEDDFFGLGGHSLQAVHVLARVQESFGVVVPLGAVLAEPTIAALARQVRRARDQAGEGWT
ncbi:amino acid adenylation domain-containing protein [Amycolatopsis sp. A133]|uniref:non-ribosomal peptide synthetase n=1 Tax=Amycolatopsis sp. A133 TaxID=3064472 RepID=UPI0027E6D367|nr:amino acid adenylation domain-containing protein [Amycolatopsis sp. A133]MDQ7803464.1 amino acid adenylation domain-containing protein [Amycolatopsis sp. A133]